MYLEVLAESGLLGALFFGLMLFHMIRILIKATRDCNQAGMFEEGRLFSGLLYGIMGYLVGSFFLSASYARYFWLLFGIAMAAENIVNNEKKIREEEMVE